MNNLSDNFKQTKQTFYLIYFHNDRILLSFHDSKFCFLLFLSSYILFHNVTIREECFFVAALSTFHALHPFKLIRSTTAAVFIQNNNYVSVILNKRGVWLAERWGKGCE